MNRAVRRLVDDLLASLDELVQARAEELVGEATSRLAPTRRPPAKKAPKRGIAGETGPALIVTPEQLRTMYGGYSTMVEKTLGAPNLSPWNDVLKSEITPVVVVSVGKTSKAEGGASCAGGPSRAVIPVREGSGDSSASPSIVSPPDPEDDEPEPPGEEPDAATPEPTPQPHALPEAEASLLPVRAICTENVISVQNESPPTDAAGRASERPNERPLVHTRGRTVPSTYRLTRAERREGVTLDYSLNIERPRTRGECQSGPRPCPFVSCRYHLYLEVGERGALKIINPACEIEDMRESCALDVADRGGDTLEGVGNILNVSRERIRQIETDALWKVRVRATSALKEHAA